MLLATAGFAAFSYTVSLAVGGTPWAIGVSTALASVAVIALIHSLLFCLTYVLNQVWGLADQEQPESPFAADKLPPQLVTPNDPET